MLWARIWVGALSMELEANAGGSRAELATEFL